MTVWSAKSLLSDLISFKTVSMRSNLDLIDYLEMKLKPLGFDTVRIMSPEEPKRANLLCKIGPDEPHGLMLSGHTDVVPVQGQNWDSDPFVLTEQGDRLIGRGTADMKGFIAASLAALSNFAQKNWKKQLTLLWTYDEEVGCAGSHHAAPILKEYLTHMPKAALIGEPTDFNILRMHSGHVTVSLRVKGKGAHSSDPSLGISAIKALNNALSGVFGLEEELKRETQLEEYFKRPFVTLNVGQVQGGTAVNIIPDEAHATIGFRPLPETSVEDIVARIKAACQKFQVDERAKLSLTIEKISPAMITPAGSDLEQILMPLARSNGPCSAQYSTDGGNLNQAGIPCLIFGPGTIDVAHQANEWINKKDLDIAVDKIASVINGWYF